MSNIQEINNKLTQIEGVKQDIKQALIDKEVDMTDVPFTEYARKISEFSGGYKKLLPSEYLTSSAIFTNGVPSTSSRTGSTGKNITQTATFNPIQIVGIVGGGNWTNDGGGLSGGSGSFVMYLTDESGTETQCSYDSTSGWYVPSDPTKKYTAIRCRTNYSSGSSQVFGILCPTSIFYK